jgi:hypothetical protein
MKREHYYIRTVELVLIFALVLYNIKTWLDHRFAGDGQDILFWVPRHPRHTCTTPQSNARTTIASLAIFSPNF